MTETVRSTCEVGRARRLTDALFAQVRPDAYLDRPIPERHRILFYLGHLEAFDWNQTGRGALGLSPVNQALDELFAFGVDPPPGELPSDRPEDWPSFEETRGYVREVRLRLDDVWSGAPDEVVQIAVEHRLMDSARTTRACTRRSVWSRSEMDPMASSTSRPPTAAAADKEAFALDVRNRLTASPKRLPCKYLYDDVGSALSEAITLLPEYGLARAEERLLQAR
jgi:hypothetical protein